MSMNILLTYIWHIFGIYLAYLWHIFGIHLAYIWHIFSINLPMYWLTISFLLETGFNTKYREYPLFLQCTS